MNSARIVFCLSLYATLFWCFGFVADGAVEGAPPFWSYALPALIAALPTCTVVFRKWPRFLAAHAEAGQARWPVYLVCSMIIYVLGAVVIGSICAWWLVPASPADQSSSGPMFYVFAYALWYPLWFAPAAGIALGAWWQSRGQNRPAAVTGTDRPDTNRPAK